MRNLAALILFALAPAVMGQSITVVQSLLDGQIIGILNATIENCEQIDLVVQRTPPASIQVVTRFQGNCTGAPNLQVRGFVAQLGQFADGDYSITWTTENAFGRFGDAAQTRFSIHAGLLLMTVTQSRSASGTTLLRLTGPIANGCTIFDQTTPIAVGNSISINTSYHMSESCFGVPPPGYVDITADVGHLPVGHYAVSWTFGSPPGLPVGLANFDVSPEDLVPQTIPALGDFGLVLLSLTLALLGFFGAPRGSRIEASLIDQLEHQTATVPPARAGGLLR